MDEKDTNLLQRVIKKRAERLGITEDEVIASASGNLQFLKAAEESARAERGSASEILNFDLAQLQECIYPGPDCVMPYELDSFRQQGSIQIDPARLEHVRHCAYCAALVSAAQPDPGKLRRFARSVDLMCAGATAGQK